MKQQKIPHQIVTLEPVYSHGSATVSGAWVYSEISVRNLQPHAVSRTGRGDLLLSDHGDRVRSREEVVVLGVQAVDQVEERTLRGGQRRCGREAASGRLEIFERQELKFNWNRVDCLFIYFKFSVNLLDLKIVLFQVEEVPSNPCACLVGFTRPLFSVPSKKGPW